MALSKEEDERIKVRDDDSSDRRSSQPIRSQTGGDRCADVENNSSSWDSIFYVFMNVSVPTKN